MKKVALHNLGCKVNAYELEAVQEMLENAGCEIVPFREGADIYIINTCTVTNIADRKSRQMLHRARKMNPEAVVVAMGCYVQAQAEKGEVDPCIDIVIGNNKKKELLSILERYVKMRETDGENDDFVREKEEKTTESLCEVIDINHTKEYEALHLSRTGEHTRAYIKVQDGCNQFCSYCIIPYARGRVRSRRKADVIEEVRRLAANGYREVVLTGIHLSSYGIDLEEDENLLSLIQEVHEVEGILRIRLGSLEPRIITEEFAQSISSLPKMCPHFHLSLQSGCDATLKRMNRHYTAQEYYEKCELLRKYFDNPALTTDVIVGFPGETEEDFQECKAFLEKVNFYETHIFKYSKREGTKAAVMEHQIPEQEKARRSNILLTLGEEKKSAYEQSFAGKEVELLIEEETEIDGKVVQTGHTREYIKAAVESERDLRNCVVRARLKKNACVLQDMQGELSCFLLNKI